MIILHRVLQQEINKDRFFFSIEISSPKSELDLDELYRDFHKLIIEFHPLFFALTCRPDYDRQPGDPCSIFSIAYKSKSEFGIPALLHLTCRNKSKRELKSFIDEAKRYDIRNFFLLRGDAHKNESGIRADTQDKRSPVHVNSTDDSDDEKFEYASEFVSFVSENYSKDYSIAVAGYPGKHPEARTLEEDILHLKEKVDNGADFIITQTVFDANEFIQFVDKCRELGINAPIIPGILPVNSFEMAQRVSNICKINLPNVFIEFLNEKPTTETIVNYFVNMCKQIMESKASLGMHFYTMNDFTLIRQILRKINTN